MQQVGESVEEQEARSCLGSFGLQGKVVSETPLRALSGGQKVYTVPPRFFRFYNVLSRDGLGAPSPGAYYIQTPSFAVSYLLGGGCTFM